MLINDYLPFGASAVFLPECKSSWSTINSVLLDFIMLFIFYCNGQEWGENKFENKLQIVSIVCKVFKKINRRYKSKRKTLSNNWNICH